MNLEKLYKMQEKLDAHILENERKRTGEEIDKDLLLDQTILALLVEVGELANATRCFKHWSLKGPESKERMLDELADVIHFYLSLGNQTGQRLSFRDLEYWDKEIDMLTIFRRIYHWCNRCGNDIEYPSGLEYVSYLELGTWIKMLWDKLGFTDVEVVLAYKRKHEENYRRQREGY